MYDAKVPFFVVSPRQGEEVRPGKGWATSPHRAAFPEMGIEAADDDPGDGCVLAYMAESIFANVSAPPGRAHQPQAGSGGRHIQDGPHGTAFPPRGGPIRPIRRFPLGVAALPPLRPIQARNSPCFRGPRPIPWREFSSIPRPYRTDVAFPGNSS